MTTLPTPPILRLDGALILSSTISCQSGLRIGAAESTIAIGGNDNPVIRDPVTGEPYIPGSSLKGKLRSLLERRYECDQNWGIDPRRVFIHVCVEESAFSSCPVCPIFGVPAPQRERWFCLGRLRIPDIFLEDRSRQELREKSTDLPFTEVKTEVAIDRLTSAAVPRSVERVPRGARFGPAQFILFRYQGDDERRHLRVLLEGMELLEADYLGSAGSRGSGRISFQNLALERVEFPREGGLAKRTPIGSPWSTLRELIDAFEGLDI